MFPPYTAEKGAQQLSRCEFAGRIRMAGSFRCHHCPKACLRGVRERLELSLGRVETLATIRSSGHFVIRTLINPTLMIQRPDYCGEPLESEGLEEYKMKAKTLVAGDVRRTLADVGNLAPTNQRQQ
jgi:hypothetical protein